jgi:hypothetical protein
LSFWYNALPNMPDDRHLAMLMAASDEIIREHEFFTDIIG